jgi:DNA-binding NtrC family response regulator
VLPEPPEPCMSASELLVADLDTCTVELCISLTSSRSLTIRTALDSDAVFDALESGLVDVLLLSQQLPGSQELELLRHIHCWYPETQAIMVAEVPAYASAVQATKLDGVGSIRSAFDWRQRKGLPHRRQKRSDVEGFHDNRQRGREHSPGSGARGERYS